METSGYNSLSKLFHRIVFRAKSISEISFEIEKSLFSSHDRQKVMDEQHVFIGGLARSGTTALLYQLYETNCFASLSYADMPLILAPNLWQKISFRKPDLQYKNRAHDDNILINTESPEAFDEVFWKHFLNNKYILDDRLVIHEVPDNITSLFGNYIDLIIKKESGNHRLRYLSKNNNSVLRFKSILGKFPNSYFIIPFRDPLQHSLSLSFQHNRFCGIHQNDPFALEYMNWIGHHEFGLNQKPFFLNNEDLFQQQLKYPKENINFWLSAWFNYYQYIFENLSDSCILLMYEQFCNEPNEAMAQLLKRIDLPVPAPSLKPYLPRIHTVTDADETILQKCQDLYEKLCEVYFDIV